jgi:hypothetical protein
MHHLDPAQLKQIFSTTKRSKSFFDKSFEYFVESGTHLGHSIFSLHKYFKHLYTVEIAQYYHDICKQEFETKNINNVTLVLGDSIKVLPNFIKQIDGNAIFWLDGHWSCGKTEKGDMEVPLLKEIEIINNFKNKCAIIIDDVRLFGSNNDVNWSDISEKSIINSLSDNRVEDYYYCNDRFTILYNSI